MAQRNASQRSESAAHTADRPVRSGAGLRIAVLTAFVLTLWLAGPRAYRVVASVVAERLAAPGGSGAGNGDGVLVPLDRIHDYFGPDWLVGPLMRVLLEDLEPRLRGDVRLMDDATARRAQDYVAASPFVTGARIERVFPDRFRIALDLRRPEIQVLTGERVVALVDADGIALPPGTARTGLPQVPIDGYAPPIALEALEYGREFPDTRIRAAARVAREWRDAIAANVGAGAPELLAVDARNVDWQWIPDLGTSQILVGLERRDGGVAWFHYGRAEDDGGAVPAATRAEVLRRVLAVHPGLDGVRAGDLRLLNRWADSLKSTEVALPGGGSADGTGRDGRGR